MAFGARVWCFCFALVPLAVLYMTIFLLQLLFLMLIINVCYSFFCVGTKQQGDENWQAESFAGWYSRLPSIASNEIIIQVYCKKMFAELIRGRSC